MKSPTPLCYYNYYYIIMSQDQGRRMQFLTASRLTNIRAVVDSFAQQK